MNVLLFSLHLVAALLLIARGLHVMETVNLFAAGRTWGDRRDTAAVCLAWLALCVGAFISLLAYVFDLQGLGTAQAWANPLLLTGAAMLLISETYQTAKP